MPRTSEAGQGQGVVLNARAGSQSREQSFDRRLRKSRRKRKDAAAVADGGKTAVAQKERFTEEGTDFSQGSGRGATAGGGQMRFEEHSGSETEADGDSGLDALAGIASIEDVGGCTADVRVDGEVALKGSHDGLPLPRCPKTSNIGRVGLQGAVLRPRRTGTSGVDGHRRVGTTVLQVEAGHGSEEKDLSAEGGRSKKSRTTAYDDRRVRATWNLETASKKFMQQSKQVRLSLRPRYSAHEWEVYGKGMSCSWIGRSPSHEGLP